MAHQLKVVLEGIEPPIWRRVLVPSEYTLYELHVVVQIVMGWEDCHLHAFTIKNQLYELPEGDGFGNPKDESQARLVDVAPTQTMISYEYDFGDSWIHAITVERSAAKADGLLPVCVDGARACPAEDSGGVWGYADKLEALNDTESDEAAELREWLGEDFDPEHFDIERVNRNLRQAFD